MLDEASLLIDIAERRLEELTRTDAMKSDPYVLCLGVLVAVVKATAAARQPLTGPEQASYQAQVIAMLEKAVGACLGQEVRYLGRKIDRKQATTIGGLMGIAWLAGGLVVAGAYAGWVWRSAPPAASAEAWSNIMRDNPDPRAALKVSAVSVDPSGRRYYVGVPLWADPAAPPRR